MTRVNGDSLFPVLNMLNTKYIIVPLQGGQTVPLLNPYAYGNAWFVDRLTFADNANQEIERIGQIDLFREAVAGKRVIMIDDSIVRGTTSDRIVRMLRDAGATEVHVRISSPPFLWPCYFGTDIPAREQLIAYNRSIEDIRKIIGADSLGYLGIDRLSEMVEGLPICKGCFTGQYPMEPPKEDIRGEYYDKEIDLERKMSRS